MRACPHNPPLALFVVPRVESLRDDRIFPMAIYFNELLYATPDTSASGSPPSCMASSRSRST